MSSFKFLACFSGRNGSRAVAARVAVEEDEHLQRLLAVDKRLKRHIRIRQHFAGWSQQSRRQFDTLVCARRANLVAMLQMIDDKTEELEAARDSICQQASVSWAVGLAGSECSLPSLDI